MTFFLNAYTAYKIYGHRFPTSVQLTNRTSNYINETEEAWINWLEEKGTLHESKAERRDLYARWYGIV